MERSFRTLRSDLVHHRYYATREEATCEIFAYIEGFYNRTSSLALSYINQIEMELRAA